MNVFFSMLRNQNKGKTQAPVEIFAKVTTDDYKPAYQLPKKYETPFVYKPIKI